jgi:hypothetical protein
MHGGNSRTSALSPLSLRIALALGGSLGSTITSPAHAMPPAVTNCDDHGPGSLRDAIADASTVSGDTIDMTQLSCSPISLTDGALGILQNDLTLAGPGSDALTLAIDDNGDMDRVAIHVGTGLLMVSGITIRDGKINDSGGCLYSSGSIELLDSVVTHCLAYSNLPGAAVKGGAVYAKGKLIAATSTISSSDAVSAATGSAYGGGIAAASGLEMKYSTVADNISAGSISYGGGVWSYGDSDISASTISGNGAQICGGVCLSSMANAELTVENSTFSSNFAQVASALAAFTDISIENSTIAFNTVGAPTPTGALVGAKNLHLTNTIVAANGNVILGTEYDVGGGVQTAVTGSNNLVVVATVPLPPNTIRDCPQLGALTYNGGPTRTHVPLKGSPALDNGSISTYASDQRGEPRHSGIAVDIGAVEKQPGENDDRIFFGRFDLGCS